MLTKTLAIASLILVAAGASAALADDGTPPTISPPANNVGNGPSMPNITLPDDWANPNTGGTGGQVNNGVPVDQ